MLLHLGSFYCSWKKWGRKNRQPLNQKNRRGTSLQMPCSLLVVGCLLLLVVCCCWLFVDYCWFLVVVVVVVVGCLLVAVGSWLLYLGIITPLGGSKR